MSTTTHTSSPISQGEKKQSSFHVSLAVLFLILLATGALFGYSFFLENKSTQYAAEIEQLKNSIQEVKKDKKLQAFQIIEKNKGLLKKMEKHSNIPLLLDHIKYINATYGVSLTNFNYSDEKINVDLVARTFKEKLGDKKFAEFVSEYRKDKEAIFSLDFVGNINGHTKISSQINFTLKK